MGKYDDIIHLQHPEPARHPRMSRQNRAAQFAPFAALTGHEDAIRETARLTENKIQLNEDDAAKLNERIALLHKALAVSRPVITVTHFVKDTKIAGGAYTEFIGALRRIDDCYKKLVFEDGTEIEIDNVRNINGDLFPDEF